jgi:hypothetical protein
MNDYIEKLWKEVTVAYFKISQCPLGETEENHENHWFL